MAGLCRPRAAATLVKALKEEVGLPVHFHTHDTSGIAAASVLAAIDAGCDAVDGALDALSGLTSQPNLGSIVEALRFSPRDPGLDPQQAARALVVLGTGAPPVRRLRERHALGRLRNLRARHAGRPVHESARAGARARHRESSLAGSRARLRRGQSALRRHRQGHADVQGGRRPCDHDGDAGPDGADVLDPHTEVAFPESVVQFFHGDLGQPYGGFPEALQRKVLQGRDAAHRPPRQGPAASGSCGRARQRRRRAAAAR